MRKKLLDTVYKKAYTTYTGCMKGGVRMDKPIHFRRAKLVRFIADQQRVIDETADQLEKIGHDAAGYRMEREPILQRLREEFKIDRDEA